MTAARTPTRRLAVAALTVATLVVAGGCGDGGGGDDAGDVASLDDGSTPDATDATTDGSVAPEDLDEAMLAFTACMRDHGVDMPDPQLSGDGGVAIAIEGEVDDGRFQEAQEACEPLMANARGDMEIDPEQLAEMQADMLAFAECMREQGIDMADPVFSDDGRVTQQGPPPGAEGSDFDGEEFEAAADACGRGEDGGPVIGVAPSAGGDAGPTMRVGSDDGEGG